MWNRGYSQFQFPFFIVVPFESSEWFLAIIPTINTFSKEFPLKRFEGSSTDFDAQECVQTAFQ